MRLFVLEVVQDSGDGPAVIAGVSILQFVVKDISQLAETR